MPTICLVWSTASVLLLIAVFRIYLAVSGQYIHFHSQNLTDGKLPTWRHGRCWWNVSIIDENKFMDSRRWLNGLGARLEWSIFRRDAFAVAVRVLDDEDDIQFHVGIPYLLSFWLSFENLPLLDRIPYKWRRNWGYETSIKFHDGSLWVHVLYAEMWGSRHGTFRKWLPSWISITTSVGYAEYKGVGFYITFSFDTLLLGSVKSDTVYLWKQPITTEIPIEPDNQFGFHYTGTFTAKRHTRWRSHFPMFKRVEKYIYIELDHPPMHQGKGENTHDLDDDGIFGMHVIGTTIEEAIKGYQEAVKRDRKKYGMGSAVHQVAEKFRLQLSWHELMKTPLEQGSDGVVDVPLPDVPPPLVGFDN